MSLALYRTYRPGRLADVIGQDHVTLPLGRALDSDRVHHAYLFTGPRGCGKTSTARILARSLNCAQGPTSTPCGVCQSCQDLAPGGPGSIDVVEMDAATNRGIDDARELREKAMYAPAASRFKVFIIDEAHQLTKEAWNALLKLIEEPPPHLRFVFATTEPDAVLATIRSRTHQYPFRLVTTRRLQEHLAWLCEQEGVPADPGALALVARAAQGSVRDSQSILGQLIAGSGPEGVTRADALAQLGFTDTALLGRLVDALTTGDGPQTFRVVDEVIESGTDPRRFATDLLERLRDLLVLRRVPDAADSGLLDLPEATVEDLRRQGAALGDAQLSRAADLVSAGLSELKGSTAPRLQLELLCARLLLPAADDSDGGLLARLERLEHRVALDGPPGRPAPEPADPPAAVEPTSHDPAPSVAPDDHAPVARSTARAVSPPHPPERAPGAAPKAPPRLSTLGRTAPAESGPPVTEVPAAPVPGAADADGDAADAAARPAPPAAGAAGPALVDLRTAWPGVLAAVLTRSRVAHTLVDGTLPVAVDGRTVVVAHPEAARLDFLRSSTVHLGALSAAVVEVTGVEVTLDLVLGGAPAGEPAASAAAEAAPGRPGTGGSAGPAPEPATAAEHPDRAGPTDSSAAAGPAEPSAPTEPSDPSDPAEDVAPDDPDADQGDTSPLALLARTLGGSVVEEYDRSDG